MTTTPSPESLPSADRSRTALVTGGARGIGREVASQLHDAGWNVAIADLQLPDHKETSEDPRLANFYGVQMNVADTRSVDAGFEAVLKRFGGLSGLVNAAGYNRHQHVAEL